MEKSLNQETPKLDLSKTSSEESTMVRREGLGHSDRHIRFDEFFASRPDDLRVCIVTHPTPDPDAIGSALGLAFLLESKYGYQCDIYYDGQVSHPQNQTEINVLDVRMRPLDDFDPEKYSTFVAVDTTPINTGKMQSLVTEWHATFDHHKTEADLAITDIRNTGSCSAIIWEYLDHFGVDFESEKGVIAATALLFGVTNDTDNLLKDNVSDLDLQAHSNLVRYIDRKKFHAIVNHPLPPYLFDLRALAAENMVNEASILISYLGILSDKRRDALPIIADEFLRMEGVETVVVFAMIDNQIQASVRSQNSSVNVHQFCQKVFGPIGGGKMGMGAAKVPIGFLYSPDDDAELREQLSEFAQNTITRRIIRHLSGA